MKLITRNVKVQTAKFPMGKIVRVSNPKAHFTKRQNEFARMEKRLVKSYVKVK
jgi:hypothetical protein